MRKALLGLALLAWLVPAAAVAETWHEVDCTVAALTLTLADTEYSYTFPVSTGHVSVKGRTNADFKYAWTSGASGTTYVTVPAGSQYYLDNLYLSHKRILYAQSATAGLVLEIEYCAHRAQ